MKYCPMCKTQKPDHMQFCDSCGSVLTSIPSVQPNGVQNTGYNGVQNTGYNGVQNTGYNGTYNPPISNIPDQPMSPVKKKSKKAALIIVAVIAVLALIGGGVFFFYMNSDDVRVQKATELIEQGKYDKALDRIEKVDTNQADALREYVDFMNEKDSFIENLKDRNIRYFDEIFKMFRSEISSFEESNEYRYLPKSLKDKCYYLDIVAGYCNNIFTASDYMDLFEDYMDKVQAVFMNDIEYWRSSKDGTCFTLYSLSTRCSTTSYGLVGLVEDGYVSMDGILRKMRIDSEGISNYQKKYFGNDDLGDYIQYSAEFTDLIKRFYNSCKSKEEWYSDVVRENSSIYDSTDRLYVNNTQPDKKGVITSGLNDIASSDDIYRNTQLLVSMLKREIVYYLITGDTIGK